LYDPDGVFNGGVVLRKQPAAAGQFRACVGDELDGSQSWWRDEAAVQCERLALLFDDQSVQHNDKHVIASLGASGMTVYDRETRAVLYANRPGSVHGVYWAAWSDGVYYFLSGAKLMKHTLATAATEVVICGGGYAWPSKGFGSATSCAVAKREVHVRSLLVNASSSALTFLSTVLSGEITTIASLRVSMSVNSGADRSASMTVAGTQVTVNQDMACPVELQTPTLRIPAAGGSAMVRVLSACAWRIAQSDTWLSAMRASETVHI
jgi:hypothetical protein